MIRHSYMEVMSEMFSVLKLRLEGETNGVRIFKSE